MNQKPSPSYSLTIRLEYPSRPGILGEITSAIGQVGGLIGAVDIVDSSGENTIRDITVNASNYEHGQQIVARIRAMEGVRVVSVSDRTFLFHLGGKIEVTLKYPLKTRDDLSMAYTPGVARVCDAIYRDKSAVYSLTIKRNMIAVVTDGTAVLGLGDIGPHAALPVMEGKAMLFKEFGGVDAFPICLDTKDPDEIVMAVKNIAPVFGGINLEDISAPRCFEIEQKLSEELDIPVFHDDQHGTAVVVMAALTNALKIVNKSFSKVKIVFNGAGAAGVACTKLLLRTGVRNIIICDTVGTIYKGRKEHMTPVKEWLASHTNREKITGGVREALEGADVFIGVSVANVLSADDVKRMANDPVVFAMANPVPEIMPEEAGPYVKVMATGRSDYPNQINNVLCFPGFFRGLLDCRASKVNDEMKLAAARAIAQIIKPTELDKDYIVPSVFDRRVAKAVASAVTKEAYRTGVARRQRKQIVYG